MSKRLLQPLNAGGERNAQTDDVRQQSRRADARIYTIRDLLPLLQMSRSSFFARWKAGQLPFLEELLPRIGRRARFRADLVDRYLAGSWGRRSFGKAS